MTANRRRSSQLGRRRHLSSASSPSRTGAVAIATSHPAGGGDIWPSSRAIAGTNRASKENPSPTPTADRQQPVGRPAERTRPARRAAAGEGVGGLADDHRHERRTGCGRQRRGPSGNGSPGRQPAATKRDEEGDHRQRRLDRAEHAERPAEHGAVEQPARTRAGGRARGGPAARPRARRPRSVSVPMSRARICSTPSASGKRPPDSAHTTNGVSSATLSVRW